jgi:hypothetical protein
VTEGGRLAWALFQESCAFPRFPFFQDPGAVQDRAQVVQAYFNIQAVTVLDKKLANTLHRNFRNLHERGCESI